jgi:hypothetical protein
LLGTVIGFHEPFNSNCILRGTFNTNSSSSFAAKQSVSQLQH